MSRAIASLRTCAMLVLAAITVAGIVSVGLASAPQAASGTTPVASPNISAPPDVVVSEFDSQVTLPVTLSAPGTSVVTVDYATANSSASGGSACFGADYNYIPVSGILTFAPGVTSQSVTVTLLHCNLSGLLSFNFNLSSAVNGTIIRPGTRIGIVGNNSANVSTDPGLYVRDAVVDNSAGTIEVPVLLGGTVGTPSASTVTVDYTTTNGSAVAGTDYSVASGSLTFGPGETVQDVPVPIIDRTSAAPTRSFGVTLSSPTNATIVGGTGVVTIGASGATAVPSPNISAPPDVLVSEDDGYVDLPVTLSAPGTSVVTVDYATANGSAHGGTGCFGADYNYIPPFGTGTGTLTFEPGVTTQVVRVDLLNCNLSGLLSFNFNLSSAVNGTIIRPGTRIGIVGNNSANVSTDPGLYVRDAVVDNSAGTIEVPVLLGGTVGTPSASTVTVDYTTTNGSAVAGTDYSVASGSLTFGPGETVQDVPVPIIDRTSAAPTRSFGVTLSSPTNATIVGGTGVVTIGASGATAVPSPNISAPPDVLVSEDDGYVDLPVTLSAPGTSVVTVDYATANSSASGGTGCFGADYNYIPPFGTGTGTLTFEPGVTTQVVRVDLLNCNLSGLLSFNFNLSSAVNGTIIRPGTRIGIVGNNSANVSTDPGLYVRDAVVDNSAGTIEVPVLLGGTVGTPSASTVTVDYTTTNGSAVAGTDYSVASGSLTFGPGETVQDVPVPIIDRTSAAPTRSFGVTLSSPTNATIVGGTGVVTIGASGATAVPSPNISAPPDVLVSEDDGYVDLPVTLSAPGTSVVTVDYATANSSASGGTGCFGADYNYIPPFGTGTGTLTFEPGVTTQVVRVDLLNCNLSGLLSFNFNLSSAVNGTIIRPGTRIGIVGNNSANVSTDPGLYVRDAVVDNSAGTIEVPVLLGGTVGTPSASTVTVDYTTTNGSAVAGTDYSVASGTLTFGPGETVQDVPVPIIDRTSAAPTRSFGVTLSSPTNATIVGGTGVVTIGASGATAVPSPNISAPPDVLVSEDDGYVDLPVTLSAPGTSVVTVDYATANGSAHGGTGCFGADYNYIPPFGTGTGTLTFEPGVTTQVVRVDLLNCGLANPGTFTFCLSSAVNGTIESACTTVTIVETATVPGASPAPTAVAGNQSAAVSFTAPTSDGGDTVYSYTVTADPGGETASGLDSPITVTGLTNGTSYTFTVTGTNAVGTGSASPPSNAVTPSNPGFIISTTSLPGGTVGSSYSTTLAASGGSGGDTWTISSGSLPAGLGINASTGAITGTPTRGRVAELHGEGHRLGLRHRHCRAVDHRGEGDAQCVRLGQPGLHDLRHQR